MTRDLIRWAHTRFFTTAAMNTQQSTLVVLFSIALEQILATVDDHCVKR